MNDESTSSNAFSTFIPAESLSTQEIERMNDQKTCWVCFSTEDDDNTDPCWVKPCKCRGTTKWVHQSCLQRWVDEKQKGNAQLKVSCPQCNTEYCIAFPDMGGVVRLIDVLDARLMKMCPFIAAGVIAGAVYWTAITYGAVTIMQVVGHDEGLALMSQSHGLVLIIGLPAIPVALVCGKMVKWEETTLAILRRYTPKVPILKYILPSYVYNDQYEQDEQQQQQIEVQQRNIAVTNLTDTICATQVFCSALMLPTIATILGRMIFESVPSRVQRTLLGGITFILVKGVFRIYHKQQKYIQKCHRKILDYVEENTDSPGTSADSNSNRSRID